MTYKNENNEIDVENIPMNEEIIEQEIVNRSGEARILLENEDKMEKFLQRLERKLDIIPVVGTGLASISILISLVRSYIKKEYQEIPIGSMIAIVCGLIYFLSPVDLVPDVVPIVGYLDDVAVITAVLKLVKDDLDEYKEWQRKNGKRIFDGTETDTQKTE